MTVASEDEFPTGEPADAATAAAVEAVVREFTACLNARDVFRLFSLVSDDLVRALALRRWGAAAGGRDWRRRPRCGPPRYPRATAS